MSSMELIDESLSLGDVSPGMNDSRITVNIIRDLGFDLDQQKGGEYFLRVLLLF